MKTEHRTKAEIAQKNLKYRRTKAQMNEYYANNKEKFNKNRIFETVEIPKLSQQEIILVLRKNPKTTLWNKEIKKWDNNDWRKFNEL